MKTSSQVPTIAEAALPPIQVSGILRTELLTPQTNRFIADNDATLGEKILDIAEAQAETMVTHTAQLMISGGKL